MAGLSRGGVGTREYSDIWFAPDLRIAVARAGSWACGFCRLRNLTMAFRGLFSTEHPADGEDAVVSSALAVAAPVLLFRLDQ